MPKNPIQIASTYPAIVGAVLASVRELRKLDQKDIAQALGKDTAVSTWSRIESGKTALTIEQLAVAAAVLQVAPSEILAAADMKMLELADRGVSTGLTRNFLTSGVVAHGLLPLGGSQLLGVGATVGLFGGREHFAAKKSDLFARLQMAVLDKLGGIAGASGLSAEADLAKADKKGAK